MSGFVRFQSSPPAKAAKPAKVTPEPEQITPDISHISHFSHGVTSKDENIATARIDGDTCLIRYTPDLYQQHRHRNGEQITVDGVPVKLIIEEIITKR
jgi:hypothetical protein